MAKEKTVYICKNCGYRSIKWLGKCPSCGEWNTLEEQTAIAFAAPAPKNQARARSKQTQAQLLSGIRDVSTDRTSTDIAELDRVLGGGVVNGELILLSGRSGDRQVHLGFANGRQHRPKSDRALHFCRRVCRTGQNARQPLGFKRADLYFAADGFVRSRGSPKQLKSAICHRRFHPNRLSAADQLLPRKYHPIKRMHRAAHALGESPRDQHPNHRTRHQRRHRRRSKNARAHGRLRLIFRGRTALSIPHFARSQNRFGTTDEIGIFSMADKGLSEVLNPSASFIAERANAASGSAVTAFWRGRVPYWSKCKHSSSRASPPIPAAPLPGVDFNPPANPFSRLGKARRPAPKQPRRFRQHYRRFPYRRACGRYGAFSGFSQRL